MLGKKEREKINEEINFAMLVVASSSRPERSKKEYLPCVISFAAHSLIFCTPLTLVERSWEFGNAIDRHTHIVKYMYIGRFTERHT